jgi:hypothetical protein
MPTTLQDPLGIETNSDPLGIESQDDPLGIESNRSESIRSDFIPNGNQGSFKSLGGDLGPQPEGIQLGGVGSFPEIPLFDDPRKLHKQYIAEQQQKARDETANIAFVSSPLQKLTHLADVTEQRFIAPTLKAIGAGLSQMPPVELDQQAPSGEDIAAIREWSARTPEQKRAAIEQNPFYKGSKFLEESGVMKTAGEKLPDYLKHDPMFRLAGEVGAYAPIVGSLGMAPITIGLQSAGEHIDRDYQQAINDGKSKDEATQIAFDGALKSGGMQTAMFAVLPGPLRKLGDRYLIDRLGETALKRILSKWVAQFGEGAVLGVASRMAENGASGHPLGKGVGESGTAMGLLQAMMPRGLTKAEQAAFVDSIGKPKIPMADEPVPGMGLEKTPGQRRLGVKVPHGTFDQPGVRELADAALKEAGQKIKIPGHEQDALNQLRRAMNWPIVSPITIATRERPGGGLAEGGQVSFAAPAEAGGIPNAQKQAISGIGGAVQPPDLIQEVLGVIHNKDRLALEKLRNEISGPTSQRPGIGLTSQANDLLRLVDARLQELKTSRLNNELEALRAIVARQSERAKPLPPPEITSIVPNQPLLKGVPNAIEERSQPTDSQQQHPGTDENGEIPPETGGGNRPAPSGPKPPTPGGGADVAPPEPVKGEVKKVIHPIESIPVENWAEEVKKSGFKDQTAWSYDFAEKNPQLTSEQFQAAGQRALAEARAAMKPGLGAPDGGMKSQFFNEASKWREALNEASKLENPTKEQLGEIEQRIGVGGPERGQELATGLERIKGPSKSSIGSFVTDVKDAFGNWTKQTIQVLSIGTPIKMGRPSSDGGWSVTFEVPSSLGKTGRQTRTRNFFKKQEALDWIEEVKGGKVKSSTADVNPDEIWNPDGPTFPQVPKESRNLSEREQKRFADLTRRLKAQREAGGEALNSLETQEYERLLDKAGQGKLFADTVQKIEAFQKRLREGGNQGNLLLGVPHAVLDTALEAARLTLKATGSLAKAVATAIDWIRKHHPNLKFDSDKLRLRLMSDLSNPELAKEAGTVGAGAPPRTPASASTAPAAPAPGSKPGAFSKFAQTDVLPAISHAVKGTAQAAADIRAAIAPPSVSSIGQRTAGNVRENLADLARKTESARRDLEKGAKAFSKADNATNLEFIRRMEGGLPQPTPALDSISRTLRAAFDQRVAQVRALGTGKLEQAIQDYFPHIWTQESVDRLHGVEPHQDNIWSRMFGKRPLAGPGSFLKQRSFPTTAEGVAAGLVPVTYNPVELALLKMREMDKYVAGQKIFQEMKQTGQTRLVKFEERPPTGWTKINDKIARAGSAGHYYAPDDAARIINNYLSPGLRGNVIFDVTRRAGNVLNQVQLGLSAYHLTFTAIDSSTSAWSLGQKQVVESLLHPRRFLPGIANMTKGVIPLYAPLEPTDRSFLNPLLDITN